MPNKSGGLTEAEIQRAIKEYLSCAGWFVFKIHQSALSYRGIADLYACKDGVGVWIEVKTPRGRQSEYQREFEYKLRAQGISYVIMRDVQDAVELDRAVKGK